MKLSQFIYSAVIATALTVSGSSFAQQNQFNKKQVKAIHTIVHNYLVKNPTVLVEASQALQNQQRQAAQQQAMGAITKFAPAIFNSKNRPTAGNPNGAITLVEFFDYQCPHCQAMGPILENLIKANSNLKIIFADWPIFGGNSQYAAQAAVAAMFQGKYMQMHMALTAKGYPLTKKDVLAIAKQVGLNVNKLQQDMKSPKVTKILANNFNIAKALKLMGTPAFIIGNVKAKNYRYVDGQVDQATLQNVIHKLQ